MKKSDSNRIDYSKNEKQMKDAFIELLDKIPIEKISIQQLANKANVSRGTFYLHFDNIYQLLEKIEDDLINELRIINKDFHLFSLPNHDLTKMSTVPYFYETYEWIRKNKLYIKVLFGINGSPSFKNKWRSCIYEIFSKKIKHDNIRVIDEDMFCTAVSSSWLGVIESWINLRDDMNSESLSKIIGIMTKNILVGFDNR